MILSIIGNRPQIIKAALVSKALKNCGLTEKVIYTWQHYDDRMSVELMQQVGLPYAVSEKVKKQLNKEPISLEDYLNNIRVQTTGLQKKIKAVLVYGDTNSTLAGTLFAKNNSYPLIHIEAGERSFNNTMPEEQNRIATDFAANLLLCVNRKSLANLGAALYKGKKMIVGDVMLDALLYFSKQNNPIGNKKLNTCIKNKESCIYFTLHRQSNTGSEKVQQILHMLGKLPYTIIWPLHPRLKAMMGKLQLTPNILLLDPLTYLDSLALLKHCAFVITDSGGLQKEAYWMQKKCVTLRADTEWMETLHGNWNTLYTGESSKKLQNLLTQKTDIQQWSLQPFGNGNAAEKIAKAILSYI